MAMVVRQLGSSAEPSDDDAARAAAARLATWGARIALVPTLLQVASGVWLLVELDPVAQGRLLGGDVASSLVFAGGVASALWLMHRLANAAMGAVDRKSIQVTLCLLAALVVFMTATLRQIERRARAARPSSDVSSSQPFEHSFHEQPAV